DDDLLNNVYYGKTKPVSKAPDDLVVEFGTNKSAAGGVSETSWTLYDQNGNVVAQRANAATSTVYKDSIKDLSPGCYRFEISDAGCDGYEWWYYQYYPVDPGVGSVRIDKLGGGPLFFF